MTDKIIAQAQEWLPNIPLTVVSQGAEAIVFATDTHPYSGDKPLIIKYRPKKSYRHAKIDAQITRLRSTGEARFMYKLNKLGVPAPMLVACDFDHGIIWMEKVGGRLPLGEASSLKNWLWHLERLGSNCVDEDVAQMLNEVGELVGKLHLNDMVHGDLTTSNVMLDDGHPCLIDFGLGDHLSLAEDRAVDLYVLERAVNSTHSVYAEQYNQWFHQGYERIHTEEKYRKGSAKRFKETMRKLEDVRLRGRKRSMIG